MKYKNHNKALPALCNRQRGKFWRGCRARLIALVLGVLEPFVCRDSKVEEVYDSVFVDKGIGLI
jgi:hypothetical protein